MIRFLFFAAFGLFLCLASGAVSSPAAANSIWGTGTVQKPNRAEAVFRHSGVPRKHAVELPKPAPAKTAAQTLEKNRLPAKPSARQIVGGKRAAAPAPRSIRPATITQPSGVWGRVLHNPAEPGYALWQKPPQVELSSEIKARLAAAAAEGEDALLQTVTGEVANNRDMADAIVEEAASLSRGKTALSSIVAAASAASGMASIVTGTTLAIGTASIAALAASADDITTTGNSDSSSDDDDDSSGFSFPAFTDITDIDFDGYAATNGDGAFAADAEYAAQAGLAQIGASGFYPVSTGQGVIVGVIDTGLDTDHEEFSGAVAGGGYDFVDNDSTLSDGAGHGTNVAGVILARRDGIGMHGVAYNASVLPVRVFDDSGNPVTEANFGAAITHAVNNGAQVINNSWGVDADLINPTDFPDAATVLALNPTVIPALQNADANNVLVVFAAGNEAQDQPSMESGFPAFFPELRDTFLTVVAVDETDTLASFSNKCGVAANWCLAAPGTDIYTAEPYDSATQTRLADGYATTNGTSFAAPHVSGALALLLDTFLGLTPQQAVEILKYTATPIGPSSTYGHGLLNLTAAMSPAGALSIPTGSSVSGSSSGMGGSGLLAAGAFGNSLKRSLSGRTLVFLDRFQRGFVVDVDRFAQLAQKRFGAADAFLDFAENGPVLQRLTENISVAFNQPAAARTDFRNRAGEDDNNYAEILFRGEFDGYTVTAQHNTKPWTAFGPYADGVVAAEDMVFGAAFANPYLGMMNARDNTAIVSDVRLNRIARLRAGSVMGSTNKEEAGHGFAGAAEFLVAAGKNTDIRLSAGTLVENNAFLGSSGTGAFTLGAGSTVFTGLGGTHKIGERVTLLGQYQIGVSSAEAAASSLMRGFRNVSSDSFALGMTVRQPFHKQDRLGVSVHQPLRVRGGTGHVNLPVFRTADGGILYDSQAMSLVPDGREIALQGWYSRNFEKISLDFGGAFRHEPDHVKTADNELMGMIKLRTGLPLTEARKR